jgi:hypothetical protein
METIADILKFVESNGCCREEVQEFHRHVEKQKEEDPRGSDRKRKRSQDSGLTKEEKHILVGGKHQVRSLPRPGSNEPASSKEYMYVRFVTHFLHCKSYKFSNYLSHVAGNFVYLL